MTEKENTPADAARSLDSTRIVNITNLDETQVVSAEDLSELEYMQFVQTAETVPAGRQRQGLPLRLGLLLATLFVAAALIAVYVSKEAHPTTARTMSIEKH